MSEQQGVTELPIYQRLLDEADAGTRATVIEQQGEGRAPRGEGADRTRFGRHS